MMHEPAELAAHLIVSRPYLVGVDDDPAGQAMVNSETPQEYLHHGLAQAPVEQVPEGLIVRRMKDCQIVAKSRNAPQTPPGMADFLGGPTLIPIALDGPDHTKWRRILDPLFAPKKMAPLEPAVRRRADEMLNAIVDKGEADIYEEWCEPLPSSVFLDLMGIPQSELEPFLWFKGCVLPSSKFIPAPEERQQASADCEAWFAAEFARRRSSGNLGEDLIGWLLQLEVDGRAISDVELQGICKLLMIAGLDTVGGTMACIIAWLARHPEERARLVADPSLWPAAIEELLRWESPVQGQGGYATADIELSDGSVLREGTAAMLYISAANLDPEAFDDPLTVKLDRSPNPHIAFATGFHRCLGSHLARMELRACLDVFHQHIPRYRVPDGVELTYWGAVRAPRPLPLVW